MAFGLLKNTTPPIAVDFGVSSLKLLQIQPGNPSALIAAAAIDTPVNLLNKSSERLNYQAQALPELLRQSNFRGKRAICSVSATQTFVQHLRVEPIQGTSLEYLLGEQIQQYSDRDPEQFILRHVEVAEINRGGRKMTEVLCIGIPRDSVLTHMQALRAAKLEPVGVHTEHVALVRSLDQIQRRAADKHMTTMIVDLGYATSKLAVSHGREPIFAKTLSIGGFHFDKAVSRAQGCSFKEARERRAAHVADLTNTARMEGLTHSAGDSTLVEHAAVVGGDDQHLAETATALAGDSDPTSEFSSDFQAERRHGQQPQNLASLDTQSAPPVDPGASALDLMEALADEIALGVRYHAALFPKRKIDRLVFSGGEAARTDLCSMSADRVNLPGAVIDPLSVLEIPAKLKGVGVNLDQPAPAWAVALGLCNAPTDL